VFDYIQVPVVDMREFPTRESKVVSQALWGEKVNIQNRSGDWLSIATPDGYSGWVPPSSIIQREEIYSGHIEVTRLSAHIYPIPDIEFGPLKTLPFGSKLHILESSDLRWVKILLPEEKEAYIQKGDIVSEPPIRNKRDLIPFSKKFLDLPYTWGGRSSFGYDCSGFVQMLYHRLGVPLPRDARQQICDGRLKSLALEEITPGDLIFFGKSEEKIAHVGMCLEGAFFIHASSRENKPYLRISSLSDLEWSGHKEATYPFRAARRIT